MRFTSIGIVFIVHILINCTNEQIERIELVNEGGICLNSRSKSAKSIVDITVTFRSCISSSCEKIVSAECECDVEANTIQVTSRGVFDRNMDTDCTGDCNKMVARCESEPLEPGKYTVYHGDQSIEVTIPAENLEIFEDQSVHEYLCEPI